MKSDEFFSILLSGAMQSICLAWIFSYLKKINGSANGLEMEPLRVLAKSIERESGNLELGEK